MNFLQPKFFQSLTKRDSKENLIFKLSLLNFLGILFALFYYYVQIFLLQNFEPYTLILVYIMAFVTIVFPMVSQRGITYSLMVIPIGITSILRGALIAIVAFELLDVSRNNMILNYQIVTNSIQCEQKYVQQFGQNLSSFPKNFEFNPDNPFVIFIKIVNKTINIYKNIFKS